MKNALFSLALASLLFNACGGTSIESYVAKADRLVADKDYRKAIILYQRAITEHPEEPVLYYNQAYLYRKMGSENDLKRAITAYKAIFRINPKLAYSHYGLANLYLEKNKLDSAAEYFENILEDTEELKPTSRILERSQLALGRIYLEKKDPDKALKHLDALLAKSPPYRDAYYYRARVWHELKQDKDKAKADLTEYLKESGKFKAEAETLLKNLDAEKKFDF